MAMDAERWARVQEILADALELSTGERDVYLADACGDDGEMRAEVESLLAASDQADEYFDDLAGRAGITQEPDATPGDIPVGAALQGRRIGAYRLGALLGRGGMGAVYLAERADGQFDLTAALKILPFGAATPEARERLIEERRILARLEHPGIARLLDGGVTEDGTPYFVMERVVGVPLAEHCRSRSLDVEARLRLFLDVCDAVSYAHAKLVVHRDLKPSNIFVTDEGQVKLLDFGIARALESQGAASQPTQGGPALTPRYASPEQLSGHPITTASDVYSLGVVLYEILTGASPYDLEETGPALHRAIVEGAVEAPSTLLTSSGPSDDPTRAEPGLASLGKARLARRLRGDLDNIVLMALRKEPGRRYSSVEALGDDVRRHLDGYPVRARPESFSYVASRFLRRHAVGVSVAALVAILLGALVVTSVRSAITTAEQARLIALERDKAAEIASFLRELFEVANPALAQGDTVTARALLDRGAAEIRERTDDDPDLVAEMMTVLGTAYHHLGLPDPALELLRDARSLQSTSEDIPPEHEAETVLRLGLALREAGRVKEAITTLTEARERLEQIHGPEHRTVALATFGLARALHSGGDPMAAEPEFQRAVSIFRALELEPDEDYAHALYMLAEFMQVNGETEGVEAMYREALDVVEQVLGPRNANVPPILSGLAWVAIREDRPEDATQLLRDALDIDRQLYSSEEGERHPNLAMSYHQLGRHLARYGDPAEAEALLREAVSIFESSSQPRPDMHGATLLSLAGHLRDTGRSAEALRLYEEAGTVFRAAFGPGSLMEAGAQVDAAELLVRSGRNAEAITALEAALRAYDGVLPSGHQRVLQARELLERAGGR